MWFGDNVWEEDIPNDESECGHLYFRGEESLILCRYIHIMLCKFQGHNIIHFTYELPFLCGLQPQLMERLSYCFGEDRKHLCGKSSRTYMQTQHRKCLARLDVCMEKSRLRYCLVATQDEFSEAPRSWLQGYVCIKCYFLISCTARALDVTLFLVKSWRGWAVVCFSKEIHQGTQREKEWIKIRAS